MPATGIPCRCVNRGCGLSARDRRRYFLSEAGWRHSCRDTSQPRLAALGVPLRDQGHEIASELDLRGVRELVPPVTPQHQQRVVILLENLVMAYFIGRDHVEIFLEQLLTGVLFH